MDFLTTDDYVYIFYSENANTFNVDSMKLAMNSVCGIDFIEANVGTPNAMDFQIVTMVYATIDADDQHYIISKDRGFDVAIKMGARCNCTNVERFPDIKTAYNDYQLKNPKEVAQTETVKIVSEPEETTAKFESESVGANIVELVATSISRTFTETDEVVAGINETKKADGDKKKIKSFIQKKCGVTVSKENLDITYDGLTSCTTKMQLYNFFRRQLGNTDGNKLYKIVGDYYYALKDVV